MAYRTGSIIDADPTARLIEQIEGAMLDQCGKAWVANTAYGGSGQEKFVRGLAGGINYRFEATTAGTSHATTEPDWSTATSVGQTVTDNTVTWTNRGRATWEFIESPDGANVYRVWRNRGSSAANPNRWGQDFYTNIVKQTTNAFRVNAFEEWDATGKMMKRTCMGTRTQATQADASYGTPAGYLYSNTANTSWVGYTGLVTTGFNYYIRATRETLYVGIKQSTTDNYFALGVFETMLNSTPVELFPLFLQQPASSLANNTNFFSSTSPHAGLSRHPGRVSQAAATYHFQVTYTSIGSLLGGIDIPTTVDMLHNGRWHAARRCIEHQGGASNGGNLPATYGWLRGLVYDQILIANNGASMRIGDTFVDDDGKTWVKFANSLHTDWLDREAV